MDESEYGTYLSEDQIVSGVGAGLNRLLNFMYIKKAFCDILAKCVGGFYEVDVIRTYHCATRHGEDQLSPLSQKRSILSSITWICSSYISCLLLLPPRYYSTHLTICNICLLLSSSVICLKTNLFFPCLSHDDRTSPTLFLSLSLCFLSFCLSRNHPTRVILSRAPDASLIFHM